MGWKTREQGSISQQGLKFKKGKYPRHIGGKVNTRSSRSSPTIRRHRPRRIRSTSQQTLVAYKNRETGTVHFNPAIPQECQGRVKVFEDVYWQKRDEGLTHEQAYEAALEAEHEGLSAREKHLYDLKIARAVKNAPAWNPLRGGNPGPIVGRGVGKVHETSRYFRVRIRNPKKNARKRTLTFSEEKGFKAVRQKPAGKPWETQSVLIEKQPGRTREFALKKAEELTAR